MTLGEWGAKLGLRVPEGAEGQDVTPEGGRLRVVRERARDGRVKRLGTVAYAKRGNQLVLVFV